MKLFKNIFKKKDNNELDLSINITGDIEYALLYNNDYIDIIHDACSICYGINKERNFEEKCDYIRRRGNHESIYEHSNFIYYYKCNTSLLEEVIEVTELCKYLNYKTKIVDNNIYILLGGSIRGFKHIVREIENPSNKLYQAILESMYNMHSCTMNDFIEDNIMSRDKFLDLEYRILKIDDSEILDRDESLIGNEEVLEREIIELDNSTIISIDDIIDIYNKIVQYSLPFDYEDLLPMTTLTVKFNKVSRSISQQLVRHRNTGITQASQRYINYSDAQFFSPDIFKPEKYEKNKKYEVSFIGNKVDVTLDELGQGIISIYPQLVKQGLLKEDARAFLPMNVETQLYMTFTFKTFIKFLELRTDKHAQKEIQIIALELEEAFIPRVDSDIYEYLEPKYKRISKELEEQYNDIDEVIE